MYFLFFIFGLLFDERFLFVVVYLFLAVFLSNDATVAHVDILFFVSVGHVVENARLVDVDGGATGACV